MLTSVPAFWKKIDWKLLLFLVLFLNVKLLIKLFAIILIYAFRPDLKFGFRLKQTRLPIFYLAAISIALLNCIIGGHFSEINYSILIGCGIAFWLFCILAMHQVKLAVEKQEQETIHNTLFIFFMMNIAVSILVYVGIIIETGHFNPYQFQGNYQKYFIGTGDYIKGISFDTSTTNAIISSAGVIYFLYRQQYLSLILCAVVVVLAGSNVTNLLLTIVLIYVFAFKSNKDQKSIVVVWLMFLVVFMVKISPQNNAYVSKAIDKLIGKKVQAAETSINEDSGKVTPITLTAYRKKVAQDYIDSIYASILDAMRPLTMAAKAPLVKEKPVMPEEPIHSPSYQSKKDTTGFQKKVRSYFNVDSVNSNATVLVPAKKGTPGKLIALEQIFYYFKENPVKLLFGSGMGNFSSKMAFRATGRELAGGYPARFVYINENFRSNHLKLYQQMMLKPASEHSVVNMPHSAYGQLWSEYGIAGLIAFGLLYVLYFAKRINRSGYGPPLLLFMLGALFLDYWFEQLSVIILFELLLFLEIKTKKVFGSNE